MNCYVVMGYRSNDEISTSCIERVFASEGEANAWVAHQRIIDAYMENIVQSYRGMDEDEAFARFEREKDLLPIKAEYFDDMMWYVIPHYTIKEVPFGPEGNDESHS